MLAAILSPLLAGVLLAVLPDLRTRDLLEDLRHGVAVDDAELKRNVRRGRRSK